MTSEIPIFLTYIYVYIYGGAEKRREEDSCLVQEIVRSW